MPMSRTCPFDVAHKQLEGMSVLRIIGCIDLMSSLLQFIALEQWQWF